MATKAQSFRSAQQRSGPPKPKSPRRPRRDLPVDTAAPGVSATSRKAGDGTGTASRNRSARSAKTKGTALESSQGPSPSRKSTRKGANRAKRTSNLRRRAVRKASSPKARAAKTAVQKK